MTQIVTTIGPACDDAETLKFFADHGVAIARLNFSHGTADWHIKTGKLARSKGLKLMVDLAGPKVLVGDLDHTQELITGNTVIFEKQKEHTIYPTWTEYQGRQTLTMPSLFALEKFVKPGHDLLIDDGKLLLSIDDVQGEQVICTVQAGGLVKNHKGINLPDSEISIDFMVERDRELLQDVIPELLPEIIAPSFVKSKQDLETLQNFLEQIKTEHGLDDYNPQICTKIEMGEAVQNLEDIVDMSDMIMVARGDLALETKPLHIKVPFLQEELVTLCKKANKPCIVATQMLESMIENPVPTRAEVSDIYRAVALNQSNYIMLSGETAAGKHPREAVKLMHDIISLYEGQK
jgi:pyruvate kinase